jgi:predicted membrane channel-forming protein YqfA (hemolysin III family)
MIGNNYFIIKDSELPSHMMFHIVVIVLAICALLYIIELIYNRKK